MPCVSWPKLSFSWRSRPLAFSRKRPSVAAGLLLCVLILVLPGCVALARQDKRTLRKAPSTPGAIVTESYVSIPHAEAADLLLWVEEVEGDYKP